MRFGDVVIQVFRVPKLEVKQVMTGTELEAELKKIFPKAQVILTDEKYRILSLRDVEDLLTLNSTRGRPWKWDLYDCDNYMRSIWQLFGDVTGNAAIGAAVVPAHALNLIRCVEGWYWIDNKGNKNEVFGIRSAEALLRGYTLKVVML